MNEVRTIEDLENIAKSNNWKLNPKTKVVENILKLQNKVYQKLGKFYCPCKAQRTDENECPCKNAQNEIDADGHCHCNLFFANK
jgi:ferredoxin-thioredoxin reductase catalytic subunit